MSPLRLQTDASPADWIAEGVGPFGSGVGSLVPAGFAAYARILHPAVSRGGMPVRWDTVAAWSGGTVHPRAQFEAIARRRPAVAIEQAPFDQPPPVGRLPEPILAGLCDVLATHTRTPGRCWFCLWDGYGWVAGSSSFDTLGGGTPIPPAFDRATIEGPRVRLPEREYLLFEGPLDAASEMGWWLNGRLVRPQSPNLFWPDDRAWWVATEIDLDSTFIGGSEALIDAMLRDARWEAWPAQPTDLVWASSDDINR
jgi:hypothetical protein